MFCAHYNDVTAPLKNFRDDDDDVDNRKQKNDYSFRSDEVAVRALQGSGDETTVKMSHKRALTGFGRRARSPSLSPTPGTVYLGRSDASSCLPLASLEGCGPSLQLGADVIKPSDQVRLLGVTVAADLSLDGHTSSVCKTCFFWLRQLRRVRRSLDADSLKTLVHAFVTSRVDYCNSVLAFAPKTVTEKLQRVQNTAARLITGTRKHERGLSQLLRDDLHWLDVQRRVQFKLAVTVHRCLHRRAPSYLIDHCVPVSEVSGRQHLRSASRCQLLFHVFVAAPLELALLPSQAQQFGTRCLTVCVTQLLDLTNFAVT